MRRVTFVFVLAAIAVASAPARSQQPAQNVSFEVASIKPSNSAPSSPDDIKLGCHGTDSHSPGITIPSNRCISRFEPLRLVVALAYDIPPSLLYPYDGKVVLGPDWINSTMYDIEAKADGPATMAELRQMLQSLLAERFQMKAHREKREMPVYALTRGKNPLKFVQAPDDRDCTGQVRRDHQFELGATSLGGQCHGFVPENGALSGRSVDMSDLSEMLAIWAGRVVIDKTGIQGLFDIKMPRMSSANAVQVAERSIAVGRDGGLPPSPQLPLGEPVPSVFAAVEQMGLKLESTKGPVDVLVIDSIEKPSEN
jgi:uncharacterized protein (TIGR03435 family)